MIIGIGELGPVLVACGDVGRAAGALLPAAHLDMAMAFAATRALLGQADDGAHGHRGERKRAGRAYRCTCGAAIRLLHARAARGPPPAAASQVQHAMHHPFVVTKSSRRVASPTPPSAIAGIAGNHPSWFPRHSTRCCSRLHRPSCAVSSPSG